MSAKRTTRGFGANSTQKRTSPQTLVHRPDRERGRVDRAHVLATTDAEIATQAAADDDVWTPAMLAHAKTVRPRKQPVTMRLDPDVLAFFQRQGRGYQSRINAVLRAYVAARSR